MPLGSQLEVCLRFCLGLGFKNQVPGVCVGVGVCVCVFVRERERERERKIGRGEGTGWWGVREVG